MMMMWTSTDLSKGRRTYVLLDSRGLFNYMYVGVGLLSVVCVSIKIGCRERMDARVRTYV